MMEGCKVKIFKVGGLKSITVLGGGEITAIVKDSISFNQTLGEKASGIVRLTLQLFIQEKDIEIISRKDDHLLRFED